MDVMMGENSALRFYVLNILQPFDDHYQIILLKILILLKYMNLQASQNFHHYYGKTMNKMLELLNL
jgi:hypothetical protein